MDTVAPWTTWTDYLWDSEQNVLIQKAGQDFLLLSAPLLEHHDIFITCLTLYFFGSGHLTVK